MDQKIIIESLKKGLFLENQFSYAVWGFFNNKMCYWNMGNWIEVNWFNLEEFADSLIKNSHKNEWEIIEKVGE